VIFLRTQVLGFGKLNTLRLEFHRGLNLIFAPNEGGKSTLQRFLIGLLYGQLRADLKVQRRLDSWVDPYKPWRGSDYGGILWCRMQDGLELEIHRSFGKDETHVEIRTAAGEDITGKYEQQRNGEVLFAYSHLGIPKGLYESIGIIRENRVAEINGYEGIRDRIANLAQSGDEELSIRRSLQLIQEKLEIIGSGRAPTKPYKQAQDLVEMLQGEQKALEERKLQYAGWIEERNRLVEESARLEREVSEKQKILLSMRIRELTMTVQTIESIEQDLALLRTEMTDLNARNDFPADQLEMLNLLTGAQQSLAKQLTTIRLEKDKASAELAQAESARSELDAYGLFAVSEGEKVTEWFVTYLGVSLQRDGVQKTLTRLRTEFTALETRLNEYSPALKNPDTDWQRLAWEAAESEQTAAQACTVLTGRIVQEKSNIVSLKRRVFQRRILVVSLGVLTVAPFLAGFLSDFKSLSYPYAIGIGGFFAALSALCSHWASKSARAVARVHQSLVELELESTRIREQGSEQRKLLRSVLVETGFSKLEDFLTAVKKSEQDRQKYGDMKAHLEETEQQREKLQQQWEAYYQLLKESLAKVGLSCSPGSLKFQIDVLRANLRRYRELDIRYAGCLERVRTLEGDNLRLAAEFERNSSAVNSLLEQAQTATPDEFREECAKRQKLGALLEKEASRIRESRRLAGDLTLRQWKEKLQELQAQSILQSPEENTAAGKPVQEEEHGMPLLPYQPTIQEAEAEEKRIAVELAGVREEYARAQERVQQAFTHFRSASNIEEDLAIADSHFQALERNRLALGIALETIQELSRQQQEVLAPELNIAVEQRFLRLCRNRYEEVKIDPDFQVWVREIYTGELRLAEHLSRGTQDQIYFSMRFGILDLISGNTELCPCLLDEPFAAYDRPRLEEAFEVLREEAQRRQLLLFTCRDDLLELAQERGAHILRLP
jgi:DNA repair exonuclease SbcCD ATPase subunit